MPGISRATWWSIATTRQPRHSRIGSVANSIDTRSSKASRPRPSETHWQEPGVCAVGVLAHVEKVQILPDQKAADGGESLEETRSHLTKH